MNLRKINWHLINFSFLSLLFSFLKKNLDKGKKKGSAVKCADDNLNYQLFEWPEYAWMMSLLFFQFFFFSHFSVTFCCCCTTILYCEVSVFFFFFVFVYFLSNFKLAIIIDKFDWLNKILNKIDLYLLFKTNKIY